MSSSRLSRLIFWALLAAVVWAPLPLASNRPWAWSLLGLWIGFLLALWAVAAWRDRSAIAVPWRRTRLPAALFLVLVGWFLFQAAPFSPAAWHHPLWQQAAQALDTPLAGAVSLDPTATLTTLMRLSSYAGVFWLGLQYGRDPARARQIFWALTIAGLGYAVYGLVIKLGGFNTILWFERWAYQGSLASTFVNRNSYAAYAGLMLLASMALLVPVLGEHLRHGLSSRAGFLHFVDTVGVGLFFLLAAAVVIASSLLLSQSRGGFLATVLGLGVFLALLGVGRRARAGATIGYGVAVLLAGWVVISFSGDATLSRFADLATDGSGRGLVHGLTVRAIAERPLLGTGLGTFADVFQLHRDQTFPVDVQAYQRAHSSYLELALEAGLPAFGALMVLLVGMAAVCLGGVFRRRRDRVYPIAGVAASVLVGAHSAVDFSLQIPAVAVSYFLLMGAACAQSLGRRGRTAEAAQPMPGGNRTRSDGEAAGPPPARRAR